MGTYKTQYWLFVGMTFVAFFIGSAVPFGILMGPMMCGIYLTCFAQRRREPVEFGLLFKGFDFFGPSVIATLASRRADSGDTGSHVPSFLRESRSGDGRSG